MSKEEVVKEMLSDFDLVMRKSRYEIKALRRFFLKTKKYPFVKAYDYVTPKTKNNWIYFIEAKTKDDIFQVFINYHYTSIGLMAALVHTDKTIVFYTSHFFTRFIEREKLDISKPQDMIKKYFILNYVSSFEIQNNPSGKADEFIGRVNTGVVLGVRTKNKIMVCNTYLSNDMLHKDQTLIVSNLKADVDNYQLMLDTGLI